VEAKAGDYYAACMDEAGIEAKGIAPLSPVLGRVAAVDSKKAFFRLLGEHEAAALSTLFRFGAAPDMHASEQTIASLGQGGLGLPTATTTSMMMRSRRRSGRSTRSTWPPC
jgi:endothelin-converting enzyme/putative endopeptidase